MYSAIMQKYMNRYRSFCLRNEGCIFAIQMENELTNNAPHLLKLKEMAVQCRLTAPIYTVTGWNSAYGAEIPEYDVVPVFGGYSEAPWMPAWLGLCLLPTFSSCPPETIPASERI